MGQKAAVFDDGSFLEYDMGAFDCWCVYLTRPGTAKYPPRDSEYFKRLALYACKYGAERLYADFVRIYDRTDKTLNEELFPFIKELSARYAPDALDVAIDFSILYMGMVAEENKANAKLGKRIKRLGVHQLLIEKMDSGIVVDFSRGKGWRELAELCQSKGF